VRRRTKRLLRIVLPVFNLALHESVAVVGGFFQFWPVALERRVPSNLSQRFLRQRHRIRSDQVGNRHHKARRKDAKAQRSSLFGDWWEGNTPSSNVSMCTVPY
jgi:hypothetical protein